MSGPFEGPCGLHDRGVPGADCSCPSEPIRTAPDFAGVLAGERCRDMHGDTYTAPWCHSCRGWAAHVTAALDAEMVAAQAEAWDECMTWVREADTEPVNRALNGEDANPYRAALAGQVGPS